MSGGFKPVFDKNGNVLGPKPVDLMTDPGQRLTLREALAVGSGKAHRGVVYAHYDFRNFQTRGGARVGTNGKL